MVPSLPGFGFSDKPASPGWNAERTARAWAVLMERLGYLFDRLARLTRAPNETLDELRAIYANNDRLHVRKTLFNSLKRYDEPAS